MAFQGGQEAASRCVTDVGYGKAAWSSSGFAQYMQTILVIEIRRDRIHSIINSCNGRASFILSEWGRCGSS
jgi:hypothetical protein